jgi:sugar (pentulose or hexulose) kinase
MSYLVIDVGSSSCRAAVVSDKGTIVSQSRCPISLEHPRPSFAEIDTDRLWQKVCRVIGTEVERHPAITFEAVGVSAMLGYVFLDKSGCPLMPAIVYADNRATVETEEIRRLFPEEKFFAITGRRPGPLLLAPKLLWLARHRPDTVKKLSCIIGLKDDIVRRMTGSLRTDFTHLDYSGVYNVAGGKFSDDILDAVHINESLFPPALPATAVAGALSRDASGQLGLPQGIPVIMGSSDGTSAMYGAGVLDQGSAVLVSGTTDVLMMCSRSAPADPGHVLSINTGLLPSTYLVGGPLGLSGGALQYFEQLLQTSVRAIEDKIDALPPGSNGLLVLPGLTGERAPYWQAHLTGGIVGLTPDHNSCHLLRAVMEGCALRILKLLGVLLQNRLSPQGLNIVGGGACLDVWNRIRSDVTGMPVRKLSVTEATCLGTAVFCKAALDNTRSLQEISGEWVKVDRQFTPDPERTRTYKRLSQLFENYIAAGMDVYQGLNEFKRQVKSEETP